jgi:hypothetical protein
MAEMSTAENEQLVSDVYTKALEARAANKTLSPKDQILYEVEMLLQEVNSGASFEQYFRWASLDELGTAIGRLEKLGLAEAAAIARRAFGVAFPKGVPASEDEKEALTQWTPKQEEQLSALADEFTEYNGTITNVLANFYRTA